jgi:hypothetical protein
VGRDPLGDPRGRGPLGRGFARPAGARTFCPGPPDPRGPCSYRRTGDAVAPSKDRRRSGLPAPQGRVTAPNSSGGALRQPTSPDLRTADRAVVDRGCTTRCRRAWCWSSPSGRSRGGCRTAGRAALPRARQRRRPGIRPAVPVRLRPAAVAPGRAGRGGRPGGREGPTGRPGEADGRGRRPLGVDRVRTAGRVEGASGVAARWRSAPPLTRRAVRTFSCAYEGMPGDRAAGAATLAPAAPLEIHHAVVGTLRRARGPTCARWIFVAVTGGAGGSPVAR